ncbi:MAG: AAA family ATPase [Alphaproteobacteria bacterium]|nr:AAA family ATPase [Alphaproteobacteria bacterium]
MKEFVLPVRELVVHPGQTVPVYVDNPLSVACLETATAETQRVVLCPQHTWNYPTSAKDIFTVGTIGEIAQVLRMPDDSIHTIIKTTDIVNLSNISIKAGLFTAEIEPVMMIDSPDSPQVIALRDRIMNHMQKLSLYHKVKMDKMQNIIQNYPVPAFIDAVVQIANISVDTAVEILKMNSWTGKFAALLEQVLLLTETDRIESDISRHVQNQMEHGQRQAILQEKLRAIQKEIGEDGDENILLDMKKKINESAMPAEAKEKAMSEFKRMRAMSPMSQEGGLLKTYLDELLSMPWNKSDEIQIDLQKARETLDSEHSGMIPVKERILEHIAVMKKTGKNRGSILCFVGAPGVGKTSLCKSIANALSRKYCRISLGGISDEAHFRGHRKTYIGAQCGRIMDALKRCKTNNPVIVLDEIDKMGRDWRGDPESALLEILDPEQNKTFRDHYLEVDFDLSNVLFIATSNTLNMSSALKDRMEIIEIPAYTEQEKLQIAREHLLQRAADDTGWDKNNIIISDDAILHIIRQYTTEQGVRELQREISTLLRRSLLQNDGEDVKTDFTIDKIDELLSVHKNANTSNKIGFGVRA